MSKFKTISKTEVPIPKRAQRDSGFGNFHFDIAHCFGFRIPIFGFFLLALLGCDNKPPAKGPANQNLPTAKMQIGSRQFVLEIASNDRTRQVGLMNRESMSEDRGMIFVFPDERRLSFWMDNTLIPLEIIYLDREGRVVSIHSMKPLDLRQIVSARPAMYAIELNQGTVQKTGVKPGDRLQIPPEATAADR